MARKSKKQTTVSEDAQVMAREERLAIEATPPVDLFSPEFSGEMTSGADEENAEMAEWARRKEAGELTPEELNEVEEAINAADVETGIVPLYGIVPLTEQDAQIRVIEGVIESSGDRAVNPLPWETWPASETVECGFDKLRVDVVDERLTLVIPTYEPKPLNGAIFKEMGYIAGFPHEFINKLSPHLAANVMNERLAQAPKKPVCVIGEGGEWISLADTQREFLPARDLAATVYGALVNTFGDDVAWDDELPNEPHYRAGVLQMRFTTPEREEVRHMIAPGTHRFLANGGDILQMGVHIRCQYPYPMTLALYVKRLVCVNGLIVGAEDCLWRGDQRTVEGQRAWIRERIDGLKPVFQGVALQASAMAHRALPEGALIPDLLANFARANGIQARLVPLAVRAWERQNEEEGEMRNEWGLANAFTRALRDAQGDARFPQDLRFGMMARMGEAVRGDELVMARLRRRDAERVRAEIIGANFRDTEQARAEIIGTN